MSYRLLQRVNISFALCLIEVYGLYGAGTVVGDLGLGVDSIGVFCCSLLILLTESIRRRVSRVF